MNKTILLTILALSCFSGVYAQNRGIEGLPFIQVGDKTYDAAGIKYPYVLVSSTTQCKLIFRTKEKHTEEELKKITWNFEPIEDDKGKTKGKMEGVGLSASLKVENIPGSGKVTAGGEVNRFIEIDAEQIMAVFTEDKK